ncbi:MAG TPA: OsmC family protein [Polyangia bacterium]|nr:OsmC family protein [Polyangia bacterium]
MSLIATAALDSTTGYAQKIEAGGHALTADEAVAHGGTNTGPSPYELLLSALGACTAITLRMYAERKKWELGRVHVALKLEKSADGADRIERTLTFGAPLSEEQRARLAEIAEKTPVTKTLKTGAAIHTTLR